MKNAIVTVYANGVIHSKVSVEISNFYAKFGIEDTLSPPEEVEVENEVQSIFDQIEKQVKDCTSFRLDFIESEYSFTVVPSIATVKNPKLEKKGGLKC